MNTLPDGDLRPSTRARQRDELIAILESESRTPPHRRRLLVPAAAAAAVVLVAGLAFAVPALRHDAGQSPAGRTDVQTPRPGVRVPAVEPLSAAEQAELGPKCLDSYPDRYRTKVIDSFKFVNPPGDAYSTRWVVANGSGLLMACGFDAAGTRVDGTLASSGMSLYSVVRADGYGAGAYTQSVARVTVTPLGGSPVDAVLRNGFFYVPVKLVRVRGPRSDNTPRPYVVRAYDASGTLLYTSGRTDGEVRAAQDECYLDPTGKRLIRWMSSNPHPDWRTCRRAVPWSWLPR
jgi:hypothetical protein